MVENRKYQINPDEKVFFHNNVDFCVGTGRMGLALQQEYQEQTGGCEYQEGCSEDGGVSCVRHTVYSCLLYSFFF